MKLAWVLGVLLVLLVLPVLPALAMETDRPAAEPLVVVAHIDSGINPYHDVFRDRSARAQAHPCTYIPGYPCSAIALPITLDARTWTEAFEADAALWESVVPGQLYWFPGTKIVGDIRLGNGGTNCPPAPFPPASYLSLDCPEHPLLDDHGHGTMTATRMGGNQGSLCPTCRVVSIEGLGGDGVRWAADQGWIDVQTNSWLDLLPPPANQLGDAIIANDPTGLWYSAIAGNSTTTAFAYAADKMVTLAASGNGAGYILGFAPTPTYILSTAAPGVILVGAHDNGRVAPWSGAPAHIVADGYGGLRAANRDLHEFSAHPMSCCTSAASPYAAGAAAALVRDARRLVGDHGVGVRDGDIAVGTPLRGHGPLADGKLSLAEFRDIFLATAQARPQEGRDDGILHWAGEPRAPDWIEFGPGGNPFCQGCWTLPLKWGDVPAEVQQAADVGYGAVNEFTGRHARAVLHGAPLPERPAEDAFFAQVDAPVRGLFFASP